MQARVLRRVGPRIIAHRARLARITMTDRRHDNIPIEAAAFRRLLQHLVHDRADVQNIDLMIVAGFCRNCLADWYREAAEAARHPMTRTRRAKPSTACRSPNGRRCTRRKPRPNSWRPSRTRSAGLATPDQGGVETSGAGHRGTGEPSTQ